MRIADYQPRLIYPDIPEMDISDYDHGLDEFIDRFTNAFQAEAAFYQFGQVRTPGVSDIDLLIIVRDRDWARAIELSRQVRNATGLLQFLFVHDPLVVCQSLLPSLPFFNSIENWILVSGKSHPLEDVQIAHVELDSRLIRHAVWNSFIRTAALELQDSLISCRRTLLLINNLLTSAIWGNQFLNERLTMTTSTEEIRGHVLAASQKDQPALIRKSIEQVIGLLNQVDTQLDQQIHQSRKNDARSEHAMISPNVGSIQNLDYLLISPLGLELPETSIPRIQQKLLENAKLVPVPDYTIEISKLLKSELRGQFPILNGLSIDQKRKREPIKFNLTLYVENCLAAKAVFNQYCIEYFFVLPFSLKPSKLPINKRVIHSSRRRALSSLLQ